MDRSARLSSLTSDQHLANRLIDLRRAARGNAEAVGDVLPHAHMRKQAIALEDHVGRTLLGSEARHVDAGYFDRTGRRHDKAADDPEQRGLAAAGRARGSQRSRRGRSRVGAAGRRRPRRRSSRRRAAGRAAPLPAVRLFPTRPPRNPRRCRSTTVSLQALPGSTIRQGPAPTEPRPCRRPRSRIFPASAPSEAASGWSSIRASPHAKADRGRRDCRRS